MKVVDITPFDIYSTVTVKNSINAEHIRTISDKLVDLMVDRDYVNRLCVSMPPRTGKSSLITLSYPFWLIYMNPQLNIMVINYNKSLAEDFGLKLRQLFVDNIDVLNDRGIRLSDKQYSKSKFMFEDINTGELLGSITLMGVGGTITGKDVDVCIIDDALKGYEDTTPSRLDKLWDWFKSILLQRLEPTSKLIILQTRWHTQDLIGRIITENNKDYDYITLKALNDDGSCIWPERYTPEFFHERKKEQGERIFQALYQGQPLDETGDFFDIDCINFENDNYDQNTAHVIAKCRSWDFAYTSDDPKKDSDYTAGAYLYLNYQNEIVLSDLKYGRFGDDLINQVQMTARHDGVGVPILMETGTTGNASEFLYKEYKKYLKGYNTKQSLPIGSKVDRATPLKDLILDGKFRINIFNDEVREDIIRQFKAFPNSSVHDDIIDAISYGVQYLLNSGGANTVGVSGLRTRKRLFR